MIHSDAYDVRYKGKPAKLYVLRNEGECWGRLVTADAEYDVVTKRDQYDQPDDVAATAFARAAGQGTLPPAGWEGCFRGPGGEYPPSTEGALLP